MGNRELKVAVFLAWRSLTRGNRSNVVLNVLIVGMVFTNMIFFPALINGIEQNVTEQIVEYHISNILIEPKRGDQYITDLDAGLDQINRIPGVQRATPHYSMGSTLLFRGRTLGTTVHAIMPREETYVSPLSQTIVAGSYLGDGDRGEVIIGSQVAGSPNVLEADEYTPSLGGVRVGDSITIDFANNYRKAYRVKGIFSTGNFDMDRRVYTSWTEMEEVIGKPLDYAQYITVRVKDGYTDQAVKTELLRYGIAEKVQTTDDVISKAMGRALESYSIIGFISTLVSLVIASVVLFIVIMVKTLNSRRQIGILKAIGVDTPVIMHSYGFQVVFLSLAGILLGFLFTGILVVYMTFYPLVTPEFAATPYVSLADLAYNGCILFLASAIAGYIPAWQVARKNVQDLMKV